MFITKFRLNSVWFGWKLKNIPSGNEFVTAHEGTASYQLSFICALQSCIYESARTRCDTGGRLGFRDFYVEHLPPVFIHTDARSAQRQHVLTYDGQVYMLMLGWNERNAFYGANAQDRMRTALEIRREMETRAHSFRELIAEW